jgi:hypothetical protein
MRAARIVAPLRARRTLRENTKSQLRSIDVLGALCVRGLSLRSISTGVPLSTTFQVSSIS